MGEEDIIQTIGDAGHSQRRKRFPNTSLGFEAPERPEQPERTTAVRGFCFDPAFALWSLPDVLSRPDRFRRFLCHVLIGLGGCSLTC